MRKLLILIGVLLSLIFVVACEEQGVEDAAKDVEKTEVEDANEEKDVTQEEGQLEHDGKDEETVVDESEESKVAGKDAKKESKVSGVKDNVKNSLGKEHNKDVNKKSVVTKDKVTKSEVNKGTKKEVKKDTSKKSNTVAKSNTSKSTKDSTSKNSDVKKSTKQSTTNKSKGTTSNSSKQNKDNTKKSNGSNSGSSGSKNNGGSQTKPKEEPKKEPEPEPEPKIEYNSAYEDKVIALVNGHRKAAGLHALKKHSVGMNYARAHSEYMAVNDVYHHSNLDSLANVVVKSGVNSVYFGENIARSRKTPESAVGDWMGSAGHRANILNENFNYIGVGYVKYKGNTYWTQVFY